MKKMIFIFSILLIASCGQNTHEPQGEIKSYDKDSISEVESKTLSSEISLSNPSFMAGSDFGNYFQSMLKRGEYEEMLKFTSSQSIDQFGEDAILDFYENEIDFEYELGDLKSKNERDNIITLNYPNANIIATKRIIRINIVVENDTCKIVLPKDLTQFPS
jgi:hypothetical protein